MIYLEIFWTFFKIGLFTIGGGHAMIPLIMREIVNKGWIANDILLDFIAISESTPGPFAVNIATFSGMEIAGIFGAILATLGVVLPSFIIITIIAKVLHRYMKKQAVQEVFLGVRSSVTGLLMSVFLSLFLIVIFGMNGYTDVTSFKFDYIGLAIFVTLTPLAFIKIKGKKIHPIFIILISAIFGLLLYGLIPQ